MRKQNCILKIRLAILIFFFFPLYSFSQDISGVWVGYMYNDTTQQTIHYELAINDVNGKTNGYSHTTFVIDDIKNIGVKEIKVRVKKDRVYVEDEKFVYDNYKEPPAKGVKMFSFLTLSKNDSAEVLSGIWRTNATKQYNPLTGSLFLEKKKKVPPEQTTIVKKLIDLGLANQLAFLPPSNASGNTVAINDQKEKPATSRPSSPANKEQITAENQHKPTIKEADIAATNNNQTDVVVKPSAKESNEKTVAINEQKAASKNNLPPAVTTTPKLEVKKEAGSKPTNKEESDLADKNNNQTNAVAQPSVNESNEKTVAINDPKAAPKNNLPPAVTTTPKLEVKKEAGSKPTNKEESGLADKNNNQTNAVAQPSAKESNEKTVAINDPKAASKNNLPPAVTTEPKPEIKKEADSKPTNKEESDLAVKTDKKNPAKIDTKGENNTEVAINEKPAQTQSPAVAINRPSSVVDKKESAEKQLASNQKINSTVGKPVINDNKQPSAVEENKNEKVVPKSNAIANAPVINKEVQKNVPGNAEKKQIVTTETSKDSKREKNRQVEAQQKSIALQPPVVEKPKVIIPPPAAELSKRTLETIRTVQIASKDSLVFTLYDNGAIDGDTVSVLLNGQVIMPRVGLLATAISKTVYLTPAMGDSISVIMYAENLGSIPPNTGLLVIHDGARIYEIRFSGDLSKNSKIILIRKKES